MAVEKVEIDAGDVWRGDTPKFVFQYQDTGDAPLEILPAQLRVHRCQFLIS